MNVEASAHSGSVPNDAMLGATYAINRHVVDKLRDYADLLVSQGGGKLPLAPVMHVSRDGWHFTALYSNSRRAHELNKTGDWVVIHYQQDGASEGRVTIVTQALDPVGTQRVVCGVDSASSAKDG